MPFHRRDAEALRKRRDWRIVRRICFRSGGRRHWVAGLSATERRGGRDIGAASLGRGSGRLKFPERGTENAVPPQRRRGAEETPRLENCEVDLFSFGRAEALG